MTQRLAGTIPALMGLSDSAKALLAFNLQRLIAKHRKKIKNASTWARKAGLSPSTVTEAIASEKGMELTTVDKLAALVDEPIWEFFAEPRDTDLADKSLPRQGDQIRHTTTEESPATVSLSEQEALPHGISRASTRTLADERNPYLALAEIFAIARAQLLGRGTHHEIDRTADPHAIARGSHKRTHR